MDLNSLLDSIVLNYHVLGPYGRVKLSAGAALGFAPFGCYLCILWAGGVLWILQLRDRTGGVLSVAHYYVWLTSRTSTSAHPAARGAALKEATGDRRY